ncbi:MAG: T9SS type B sorting domain-containing protein [Bacteroidetes bacterium]|nr:hypothetical protein [Bacteroidota bacterium]MCL4816705.1 gliding motility-associated C-terminal domain-containing protein [Flavobacteriales bacterium]WKZ75915.1 MAG: gliding motility-associated C-terminal domain-containing protein [Vicingaceae bacterium]NOG95593.1 T9SS type B sorting domain-containing protein [Bacteroidota bacterium]CAG0971579.1 hypothetical protein FLAV_01269 [Flavobacteriales bacterium]
MRILKSDLIYIYFNATKFSINSYCVGVSIFTMKQFFNFSIFIASSLIFISVETYTQNSLVGDGFGGRLWYKPSNYTVGSYSAYSICYTGLCSDGPNELRGWGSNNYNQLGLGISVLGTNTPVPIPNMDNVYYYSTGYIMGAIKKDFTGWVWGEAGVTNFNTPMQVINDVKFLDASISVVSFVKNDGTVWSVGDGDYGNFGNGLNATSSAVPVKMLNITNAVRVANGFYVTHVLLNDGTVWAVGSDYAIGALGIGTLNGIAYTPVQVQGLSNIVDIKSCTYGSAALDNDGNVFVWGDMSLGLMGPIESSPVKVPNLSKIVAISGCADGYHFMALDENKNCFAWGADPGYFGYIEPSGNKPIYSPVKVASDVIDIMAGELFSYILKSDATLWCSGISNGGSIWLNLSNEERDEFTKLTPEDVPGACGVLATNAAYTPVKDCKEKGSITIYSSGGKPPYQYSIGDGFQTSNVFYGVNEGTYYITVLDANNCETNTTVDVSSLLNEPCIKPVITVPNVFTPNEDELNNVFKIKTENIKYLYCQIYNRWGTKVYEWEGIDGSWNGKNLNEKDCSAGTYYYVVRYIDLLDNTESLSGYITLLRN